MQPNRQNAGLYMAQISDCGISGSGSGPDSVVVSSVRISLENVISRAHEKTSPMRTRCKPFAMISYKNRAIFIVHPRELVSTLNLFDETVTYSIRDPLGSDSEGRDSIHLKCLFDNWN